jgi:putative CocE/NonD family hydrolase
VGASADGIASLFDVIALPATPVGLKAMLIVFATGDARALVYPGGAFNKALVEMWLNSSVPKFAAPLIQELKDHEDPTSWWLTRTVAGHFDRITWPAVLWGGWYDIFLQGLLWTYDGFQTQSSTKGKHRLVVDPLGHCQKASTYFPDDLIAGRVLLPIFLSIDMFRGTNIVPENVKAITFYVMGPNELFARGNHWTTLDSFPSYVPTPYYMAVDRSLSTVMPPIGSLTVGYIYDPQNPVPTVGGNNLDLPCGPLDQRAVEEGNRTDVLTFTTAILTTDVWVTGPLEAVVYISSSAVDTDFTMKLTDVSADGTSHLIQDGIARARWGCLATGCKKPQLLTPGKVYPLVISLVNTSYVFNMGHRIRVSVSSSNYPRFDINPNNGLPINGTTPGPNVTAKNVLYTSASYPSAIILPVIQPSQVPPVEILQDLVRSVHKSGKGHLLKKFFENKH